MLDFAILESEETTKIFQRSLLEVFSELAMCNTIRMLIHRLLKDLSFFFILFFLFGTC